MKKQASTAVIAAACAALFAAPALAQGSSSGSMSGGMQGNMPSTTTQQGKMPMPMKSAKTGMALRRTCADYAWQSKEMKDCEAGKIKPPN
jgi:hypothetical protein